MRLRRRLLKMWLALALHAMEGGAVQRRVCWQTGRSTTWRFLSDFVPGRLWAALRRRFRGVTGRVDAAATSWGMGKGN